MPSFSPSLALKAVKDSAFEYLFLVGLWMLLVSMTKPRELVAGLIVALIAAVADGTIKATGYAKFKPRLEWLPLIFWEAWYALEGTWAVLLALVQKIAGKKMEARIVSVPMNTGGNDAESWARRALMIAYLTIAPNSIVLGIDLERQCMLMHQFPPAGLPLIAQRLSARKKGIVEVPQS